MNIRIPKELGAVAKFCSIEPVRYALMGVRVEGKGGTVRVTASDGKRMVDIKLKNQGEVNDGLVLLPKEAFLQAVKSCGKTGSSVYTLEGGTRDLDQFEVIPEKDAVKLKVEDAVKKTTIEAKPIEGTFLDVDSLYQEGQPAAEMSVNPRILGEALLALDAMKTEKYSSVKMKVYPEKAMLEFTMTTDNANIRALVMGLNR